jgi:uncharacterized membrane protein YozB (DUF420 family)
MPCVPEYALVAIVIVGIVMLFPPLDMKLPEQLAMAIVCWSFGGIFITGGIIGIIYLSRQRHMANLAVEENLPILI